MTKDIKYSAIFVELDALLDTRIATLANMGDGLFAKAYTKYYYERPIDQFPNISNSVFNEAYSKRDKRILKDTMITPIGEMINEFVDKTLKQVLSTPFHYTPKVILNIYPYKLDKDEIAIMLETIFKLTKGECEIEIVYLEYKQITPNYLNNNVSIFVIYEYYKWLEIHSSSNMFKSSSCPEVTMFGPRIYFKPIDKTTGDMDAPFKAMETLAAPFIGLKLINIENYCLVYKPEV